MSSLFLPTPRGQKSRRLVDEARGGHERQHGDRLKLLQLLPVGDQVLGASNGNPSSWNKKEQTSGHKAMTVEWIC